MTQVSPEHKGANSIALSELQKTEKNKKTNSRSRRQEKKQKKNKFVQSVKAPILWPYPSGKRKNTNKSTLCSVLGAPSAAGLQCSN